MATVTYSWNQDFDFLNKVINTTSGGAEIPDVAALTNGDFIATWGRGGSALSGRILTSDGLPGSSTDFPLHPQGVGSTDASVAALGPAASGILQGGAAIAVYEEYDAYPESNIWYGVIGPSGNLLTSGALFGDPMAANDDFDPDITVLADGGLVVTWTRDPPAASEVIMRQVFNSDLSTRADASVVSDVGLFHHSIESSVASLAGGGFVVAYKNDYDWEVYFRRYAAAGNSIDALPVLIDTAGLNYDIQVLGLLDGGFVVAYVDNEFTPTDTGNTDIHVRIYNANGSERIDLGRINNFTAGAQDKPALALLSNGFFVVGWQVQGGLKVQAFDPSGNEIGPENQDAFSSMIDAELAGLADGRLVNVRSTSSGDFLRASASDLVRTTVGNATNETLLGDELIDVISGAGGRDRISGGGANDALNGGAGRDTVSGGAGNDSIAGGSSGDVLDGGRGADMVAGGIGNDFVGGAQGQDQLTGNAGADTYIFAALSHSGLTEATRDFITDFEDGNDKIDVSGIDAIAGAGNDPFIFGGPFTAGHIRARQSGADTILRFNTDGDGKVEMTILLKNVGVGALNDADFVL